MCGHATLAMCRFAIDTGLVDPALPTTKVTKLDSPHPSQIQIQADIQTKGGSASDPSPSDNEAGRDDSDALYAVTFTLQTPCGPVTCTTQCTKRTSSDNQNQGSNRLSLVSVPNAPARYVSVPSFCVAMDLTVEFPRIVGGGGDGNGGGVTSRAKKVVTFDLAFGGAFYAIVKVSELGLDWDGESSVPVESSEVHANTHSGNSDHQPKAKGEREVLPLLIREATSFLYALRSNPDLQSLVQHPTESDLSFLYGVIVTDEPQPTNPRSDRTTSNVCVFADGQVDRSPTGSGVQARLALMYARARKEMKEGRVEQIQLTDEEKEKGRVEYK
ncbi:Trans-L-3-hydroxyproline dehydratase, partial [Quaeritorhiza haematococci]